MDDGTKGTKTWTKIILVGIKALYGVNKYLGNWTQQLIWYGREKQKEGYRMCQVRARLLGEYDALTKQNAWEGADWVAVDAAQFCLGCAGFGVFKVHTAGTNQQVVEYMGLMHMRDIAFRNIVLRISRIKVLIKPTKVNSMKK